MVAADPVGEAFRSWLRACTRAGWTPGCATETVALTAALGRVTAADVHARWSVPAYRAAAMDGIAVAASAEGRRRFAPDSFVPVDTGDPLPDWADRVIMRELLTTGADGGVELTGTPAATPHVRAVGEDMRAGDLVLPAGHAIRPVDVAAVAAAGYVSLVVRQRPRVVIVPTGDEVRPLGSALAAGEVLDTNSLMLSGLLAEAGCAPEVLAVVPDDPDQLAAVLRAAAPGADLVLVIAGSSAGRDDHTARVIADLGRVAVHGVAVRPGHPVVLGALGGDRVEPTLPAGPAVPVVGVPGYPASAERAHRSFVLPMVGRLLGTRTAAEHPVPARLAWAVTSAPWSDEYLRVGLASVAHPTEHLVAVPLARGAGARSTLAHGEGVLRIPAGVAGFAAGEPVEVTPVPGATLAGGTVIVAGHESAPMTALMALCRMHRSPVPALDALADGLCHAAAMSLRPGADRGALVERLGPVTVLEVARSADRQDVLVVPAAAFDSGAVVTLRGVLSSMPFRRRLRELAGWSGRISGRETWHEPDEGSSRCATR